MFVRAASAIVLVSMCSLSPAVGQPTSDLASKIVNDPSSPTINGARGSLRADAQVQGGQALRVDVPRKGANVWDSAVESVVTKPVKAGDELVLVFSARLAKGDKGATESTIPYAAVQLATPPYSSVLRQSVTINADWKPVEIRGVADKDYAANSLKATIHLATAKQSVELGPVVVFDLGPKR